jgi:hypothetical protein
VTTTLFISTVGVCAALPYGQEPPASTTWATRDRLHITDATWAAARLCRWTGMMPDPRTLKNAAGASIYTLADVRIHRDLLLARTDYVKGSSSTNALFIATVAARTPLFALPDTPSVAADPSTASFPILSTWDVLVPNPTLTAA